MEYTLRFFLDGAECTDKEHTFKYTHAARVDMGSTYLACSLALS